MWKNLAVGIFCPIYVQGVHLAKRWFGDLSGNENKSFHKISCLYQENFHCKVFLRFEVAIAFLLLSYTEKSKFSYSDIQTYELQNHYYQMYIN